MSTLSMSELKARLPEQIRRVKAGEEIVVTERGMPVARLVRLPSARLSPDSLSQACPPDPDGLVRQAVLEEREGGR